MREENEANRVIDLYADMVRRICFLYLKNEKDVEDVFQDVFLKYILSSTQFANAEHEKAWFIRVTINRCKDLCKSFFKKDIFFLQDIEALPSSISHDYDDVFQAVLSLPPKYKAVIYLYFYEQYPACLLYTSRCV